MFGRVSETISETASHHVENSAKIWYNINKKLNRINHDNNIFTNILLAFLNHDQLHQSVIYKYQATKTIKTIMIQYIYANILATFMMKSAALSAKFALSAAI